jgi:cation diffusion facilitator family transporter
VVTELHTRQVGGAKNLPPVQFGNHRPVDGGAPCRDHGAMVSSDARALFVSMWASVAFAVVSLVWGLALGSQLIVFDGLYSFASVGLSLLAVLALRTAGKGADERYPWGREAWEPVAIVIKAAALGALCVYAVVGAVGELLRGGREVEAGWAVLYAVLATVAGAAVSLYLRRRARHGSDLLRAEAAEWLGDTLLSLGVLAGFLLALVLERTGQTRLAGYVDPAMVAVISLLFLRVPAKLLGAAMREVLAMAPPVGLVAQVRERVDDVRLRYGFAESFLRCGKVGARLDVEVDFVVDDASRAQTVREFDDVRADLHEQLTPLGNVSMSVAFTADRKWAL